jgi:hypothetical protein
MQAKENCASNGQGKKCATQRKITTHHYTERAYGKEELHRACDLLNAIVAGLEKAHASERLRGQRFEI